MTSDNSSGKGSRFDRYADASLNAPGREEGKSKLGEWEAL